MYVPGSFAETDAGVLAALIGDYGFATLVGVADGAPFASHVPLLYDRDAGPHGTLTGHLARANPHWRCFGGGALAIFHGPHAYISPTWYASTPAVPTWNYAVVHAYGTPRPLDDAGAAQAVLERLIAAYEPCGWSLDRLDGKYLDAQIRGIAAFEIPITRLEGKFKLNQNKSPDDRRGAIAGLRAAGDAGSAALADLMARREGE